MIAIVEVADEIKWKLFDTIGKVEKWFGTMSRKFDVNPIGVYNTDSGTWVQQSDHVSDSERDRLLSDILEEL